MRDRESKRRGGRLRGKERLNVGEGGRERGSENDSESEREGERDRKRFR